MSPNATHRDAEVYAKPNEFQFKRFVDDPKFFKGGQLVKTPLLPFGGGNMVRACEVATNLLCTVKV